MTEKMLNMKTELKVNNTRGQTSQKTIKANIKRQLNNENINVRDLSKKTHINICKLLLLLYCPLLKVRLSDSIKICEALKLNVSDIVV